MTLHRGSRVGRLQLEGGELQTGRLAATMYRTFIICLAGSTRLSPHSSTFQSMAGLERLVPYIYHEKQQEGSMLCAQHALNSLLRTSRFAHLLLVSY